MENIKNGTQSTLVNRSFESSFGTVRTNKNRVVSFNALETFIYNRTSAEGEFKENSRIVFSVIYRTVDAIAPFELDHHGPVTIGLLEKFCNRPGIENLKKMVTESKVKYRKDIAEKLNMAMEYSDTYLDAICSTVHKRIEEYADQEIR